MLTDSDNERFDSIMESVLRRREEREFMPDRDEDKIAEIIQKWENSAEEEHARLIESKSQFADPIKYQPAATRSENLRNFPKMTQWKRKYKRP